MTTFSLIRAAARIVYHVEPATEAQIAQAQLTLEAGRSIGFLFDCEGMLIHRPRVYIEDFVFNDADFFVGKLNTGDVRIGMVGGQCFTIPQGHAWYDRVVEADTRVAAEDLFDELFGIMGVI